MPQLSLFYEPQPRVQVTSSQKPARTFLPCGCERREGTWPVGALCDEGERLLGVKNDLCEVAGAVARGEASPVGDIRHDVWAARRALLVHAMPGSDLWAWLEEEPRS